MYLLVYVTQTLGCSVDGGAGEPTSTTNGSLSVFLASFFVLLAYKSCTLCKLWSLTNQEKLTAFPRALAFPLESPLIFC